MIKPVSSFEQNMMGLSHQSYIPDFNVKDLMVQTIFLRLDMGAILVSNKLVPQPMVAPHVNWL